mmetsp:Transcript_1280/g.1705  ORF Transcript_1280/g.1705 Transcript_1280/m.1705 type:complete len:266 (-) Transcript_1280:460-1257(-)
MSQEAAMSNNKRKPVALIIGAGAGIGGHIARRFAAGGYHSCLCRRSNSEGLDDAVNDIIRDGGSASGVLIDVTKVGSIERVVEDIENRVGPIEVGVYNLGAQIGSRTLTDTTHKQFELGWRLGTFGLFRLAQCLLPRMEGRGSGSLLVTSATAAVRGDAGQHSHAAAMGGRRMLCQTLNAEFAKKNVHISHLIIDGPVDAPDTLGKMMGTERFSAFKKARGEHGVISPSAVAETYWHLAHQHPSARSFEIDIRSKADLPWWNSRL